MTNRINNAKCAQWMLDCMEGIDLPNVRKAKYNDEKVMTHEELLLAIKNAKSYEELELLLDISIKNAEERLEKFKKYLPESPK